MKCKTFIILSLFCILCSCRTIKETSVYIDKEQVVNDMIYDLANSYVVPEIGTVYDYLRAVNIVTEGGDYVMYSMKVKDQWYKTDKFIFNKYKRGDIIKPSELKKIKQ